MELIWGVYKLIGLAVIACVVVLAIGFALVGMTKSGKDGDNDDA